MPTPNYSIIFSAQLVAATTVTIGKVLLPSASDGTSYVVATTANRGSRRSEGIALTAWNVPEAGSVQLQQSGTIDATVSGLTTVDTGLSLVRCSATGTIERVASPDYATDDLIGVAEEDGRVHLYFGFPFSFFYALVNVITLGGSIGDVLIKASSTATSGVAPGTSGNYLRSNGSAWVSTTGLTPGGTTGSVQGNDGAGGLTGYSNVLLGSGFISIGSNPASAGELRLTNLGTLSWRNLTNTDDIHVLRLTNVDGILLGDALRKINIDAGSGQTCVVSADTIRLLDGNSANSFIEINSSGGRRVEFYAVPWIRDSNLLQSYKFAVSNITADRTITLPLLTGDDTFVFQAHTQTLTNKTISADDNSLTSATALTGDALVFNGTKFVPDTITGATSSGVSGIVQLSNGSGGLSAADALFDTDARFGIPLKGYGSGKPYRRKSATVSITGADGATTTASQAEYECPILKLSEGGGGGATAYLVLPDAVDAIYIIYNNTARTIYVNRSGGGGTASLGAGNTKTFFHDGSDYRPTVSNL